MEGTEGTSEAPSPDTRVGGSGSVCEGPGRRLVREVRWEGHILEATARRSVPRDLTAPGPLGCFVGRLKKNTDKRRNKKLRQENGENRLWQNQYGAPTSFLKCYQFKNKSKGSTFGGRARRVATEGNTAPDSREFARFVNASYSPHCSERILATKIREEKGKPV